MTAPMPTRPWPRCKQPGCRGYAGASGLCPAHKRQRDGVRQWWGPAQDKKPE